MSINELYKLPHKKESIKKIDQFIASSGNDELCHHQAICLKSEILFELEKINEALKPLLQAETSFNSFSDEIIVLYSNALKDIFMSIEQYDKALKYIDIKHKHLSLMEMDSYIKDMILYHQAKGEKIAAKRYIIQYLEDDLSTDERIFAYENLINYHFEDKNLDDFYTTYDVLYYHYFERHYEEKLHNLEYLKIQMLVYENRYEEAIELIKTVLNSPNLSDELQVILATMIIDIYIEINDLKRASIFDAQYADLAKKVSYETALVFYNKTKRLYERLNNRYSVELIEKLIAELNEANNTKEEIVEPVSKRKKKSQILEPIIIEKIINKEPTIINKSYEPNYVEIETEDINISHSYKSIGKVLEYINTVSYTTSVREILRQAFIKLQEYIPFNEVIILKKHHDLFDGYHYKMERLYEKKYDNEEVLKKSLPYRGYEMGKDIISKNAHDIYYNMSIITNDITKFSNQIILPIFYNEETVGSISFVSTSSKLIESINYELLKIISLAINLKISEVYNELLWKESISDISFLVDNMSYGVVTNKNGQATLNNSAKQIYDVSTNYLTEDELLYLITPNDRIIYKNTIDELKNEICNSKMITYQLIDKRYICENFYLVKSTDEYCIISILREKTSEIKALEYYDKKASVDPFTKLDSLNLLKQELKELNLIKHYSFVLFDAKHFKLYKDVYGIKFATDLILAIGIKLNEIVKKYDSKCYHYDSDKFIILLNNNDERKTKRLVKEILDKLSKKLLEVNKRVSLTFNAAIFRMNKSKSDYTLEMFIEALSNTLEAAKEITSFENNVLYFDSDESKSRYYDFQMELHISEAIDNGSIRLVYNQIADTFTKNVYAYEAKMNLSNVIVDEQYFYNILKKRNLYELHDKYLILHSIMELKEFYKEFGGFFKVFIKIHSQTLASKGFLQFLEEKFKFFKVPASVISFEIVKNSDDDIKEVCKILKDQKLLIGSNNINTVLENDLSIYFCDQKKFSDKHLASLKTLCDNFDIEMILSNVSERHKLEIFNTLRLNLIKGSVLNKVLRIEDIVNQTKKE